jgi:D-sedoheptulose 7-phosphate isomerase
LTAATFFFIVAAMNARISTNLGQSIAAKQAFAEASGDRIIQLVDWLTAAFRAGGKLLILGNGGSAADAQHVAAEFVNRFRIDRRPLPAIALTTDTSVLTSIGNDYGYDLIFAKQVEALGRPGDVVLAISTSGRSPNVIRAVEKAREMGLKTAALTGGASSPGGGLASAVDLLLNVPTDSTPHIQETHLWIEHMVCELVEEELFGNG